MKSKLQGEDYGTTRLAFSVKTSQNRVFSYLSRQDSSKFDYKSRSERRNLIVVFFILYNVIAKSPISDRTTGVYSVNYIMFWKS